MNRIPIWIDFWKTRPAWMWALPILAIFDLLVYGHVFFSGQVISHRDADLAVSIWGFDFVYGELAKGNLPLWNPHILSGTPAFASFQTLVLYPLAWPFMVLPSGLGCNLWIVFHVFWIGAGMFWWLSRRGLHPLACLVGATMLMFGSPTTLQIYAGHISVLSAMSWAPWLLLVFDALIDEREKSARRAWVLAGIFFVAMQIAAGFPQHVFYTAGMGALYFGARLLAAREYSRWARCKSFGAFCTVYFCGAMLMMVQLLTSWQTSKETARATALSFDFIAMSSFPPENFLTLFAPTVFGNETQLSYWGRWFSWEVVFFLGASGIFLALFGLCVPLKNGRRARWLWAGAAVFLIVLAMGKYTPLLKFLYDHVPVFGSFRTSSRALFEASIFVCALAALGLDRLLRAPILPVRALKTFAIGAIVFGLALTGFGFWVVGESALSAWRALFHSIASSNDYFIETKTYFDPKLLEIAPTIAMQALMIGGLTCVATGVLLWFARASRRAIYLLAAMAIVEIALYAFITTPTFSFGYGSQPRVAEILKNHPGNHRFIKTSFNNLAMRWGALDMGGYESFRLRRYDEFAHWSQGKKSDVSPVAAYFKTLHPIYRMLRCRFLFDDNEQVQELKNPLPHVLLIEHYRVISNRDAIFKAMENPKFDPAREVILEAEPKPRPQNKKLAQNSKGTAQIEIIDTDTLEIHAHTPAPTILLVTDSYSKDWKVTRLPDGDLDGDGLTTRSAQREYSVMPANYVLRAIPLQAGNHAIRLEYSPPAFHIGKWISLASLALYFLALGFHWKTRRRAPAPVDYGKMKAL